MRFARRWRLTMCSAVTLPEEVSSMSLSGGVSTSPSRTSRRIMPPTDGREVPSPSPSGRRFSCDARLVGVTRIPSSWSWKIETR